MVAEEQGENRGWRWGGPAVAYSVVWLRGGMRTVAGETEKGEQMLDEMSR